MTNIDEDVEGFIGAVYSSLAQNTCVTWLNHSSFLRLIRYKEKLREFSVIGVDGIFLQTLLLCKNKRTSADLVLPKILATIPSKAFLVGGEPKLLQSRKQKLEKMFPTIEILFNIDGFRENLLAITRLEMLSLEPNIIIIGMGAPHQELLALELSKTQIPNKTVWIFTCGGWLDQVIQENYYPQWAYPLRLNWLVRLYREPRRLWKRYTLEPWIIFKERGSIRFLRSLANLR